MNSKTTAIVFSLVAVLAVVYYMLSSGNDARKSVEQSDKQTSSVPRQGTQTTAFVSMPTESLPQKSGAIIQSTYKATLETLGAPSQSPRTQTIQISNAGDHAVLRRQNGDVVWDAAKEKKPLYAAKQSPDGKHVILSFGNGKHDLYSLEPFKIVKHLPPSAPVERGTAFESWAWVDAARLIGVSAVEQAPDKLQNLTAAEREARWCERMLIYVYDLERAELMQVQTDGLPIPPVFEVSELVEGGRIQIGAEVQGKGWQTVWLSVTKQ